MIYLVTNQIEFFEDPDYKIISPEQSLEIMQDWKIIQVDTETSGKQ